MSVLHIKFNDLIKNQTNNIIEKLQNHALKSEIFERDIERMKPLAIDINDLEKKFCNQKFELAFVSSLFVYSQYFVNKYL